MSRATPDSTISMTNWLNASISTELTARRQLPVNFVMMSMRKLSMQDPRPASTTTSPHPLTQKHTMSQLVAKLCTLLIVAIAMTLMIAQQCADFMSPIETKEACLAPRGKMDIRAIMAGVPYPMPLPSQRFHKAKC